ncbi:hypothetical protein ACWGIA_39975 [Streptomyces bobili]
MPRWADYGDGSCAHCLAWTNDRAKICNGCKGWRHDHPTVSQCRRCQRQLPLRDGFCRMCTLVLRETEIDISGTALAGGDQLWFGRGLGLSIRSRLAPGSKGRFLAKEKHARAAERARRPTTPHLVQSAQLALFDEPVRDWTRLDPREEYALTPAAQSLLHDFAAYLRRHDVDPRYGGAPSLRTLRVLLAHLGAEAPVRERDVAAIATLSSHHNGRRVIHYLRGRGLLEPDPVRDSDLIRARRLADSLPAPFAGAVHLWIDVLLGQGSRPSPARASATIFGYVWNVAPILLDWADAGITDFREITSEHVAAALHGTAPGRRRSVHPPLRSLFRALRRERRIFRDPARHISLTTAARLPVPLPSDTLKGLLTRVSDARGQLIIALVAIHALAHEDLAPLLLEDLDRTRGRLRVRQRGRPDHYVYLDEVTAELAAAWLRERYRRWPRTANPHLLVSRVSATDETSPRLSTEVTKTVFERAGVTARRLREDRIYDEARHTADPVHLLRFSGCRRVVTVHDPCGMPVLCGMRRVGA